MHHAYIDRFAQGDSPIHRLDARVKLLAVLAYTGVLVSFDRYTVAGLAPMAIGPVALLFLAGVPLWFALRRAAVLSPFILMLCVMSPFYDRLPQQAALGPWRFEIAGGYLAAAGAAGRFCLGLIALTALTSTTPFGLLLEGMRRMGSPKLLAMQLGLVYRYVFVLIDEAMRIRRGRDFRLARRASAARRLRAAGGMVGSLFVRTLDRSDRIHLAMCARGYRGEVRNLKRLRLRWADLAFLAVAAAYLLTCRWLYPAIL